MDACTDVDTPQRTKLFRCASRNIQVATCLGRVEMFLILLSNSGTVKCLRQVTLSFANLSITFFH